MLRELNEEDFCPKCLEYDDKHEILYMGRANLEKNTVEFRCPMCDYVEVREVSEHKYI